MDPPAESEPADQAAEIQAMARSIAAGDRRALARAITLIESTRADHQRRGRALLHRLLAKAGEAVRIGITGAPGVGKSSLIEAFGASLTGAGHKVAVLTVDPSSNRGGGSILGDKTRMEKLAREANAFIRPSPAAGSPGGIARRTREAVLLVEAAGFDVVLVETVGVGQSEAAVADMVDVFVLLLAPGSGDELQGIKRGIIELADLVVVNKADGELTQAAERTAAEYRAALHLIRPKTPLWSPRVLLASALTGGGIDEVWQAICAHREALVAAGALKDLRAEQARAWLWRELGEQLRTALGEHAAVAAARPALEAQVAAGEITPAAAAETLMQDFLKRQ